jgi:hypothetical protein
MLLREDILPQSSACKSVKGEEVCTMAKKYEHFWDRLAHDPTLYKHLKQDWSKWKVLFNTQFTTQSACFTTSRMTPRSTSTSSKTGANARQIE